MSAPLLATSELVGGTPLLRLNLREPGLGAEIFGKVEQFNPTGSVKDRASLAMVEQAERQGLLGEGGVIVEGTSGNTGIALAAIGAERGYRVVVVMPDAVSPAKVRIIRSYGAEIIFTPAAFGIRRSFAEAARLAASIPGAFVPNQSTNPANPAIHRRTTGPEIWAETGGKVDVFVAGVGTGGTLTGVAEFLAEQGSATEIVAVEPRSSAVLSGGAAGPHQIEGIGAGFIPPVLRTELIHRVETVSDEEAFAAATLVSRRTGISVGPSSGAAVAVCLRLALKPDYTGRSIVTVLPDSGDRYLHENSARAQPAPD